MVHILSFESSKSWPSQVKTKVHFPEGFFKDNSASKIAFEMKKKHDGDIGKSIRALTFQLNRNSKQSASIKAKIKDAISILEKEKKKETK